MDYLKDSQLSELYEKYRMYSLLSGGLSLNLCLSLGCVLQQGEHGHASCNLLDRTPLAAHHDSCLGHIAVLLHLADPKLEKMQHAHPLTFSVTPQKRPRTMTAALDLPYLQSKQSHAANNSRPRAGFVAQQHETGP